MACSKLAWLPVLVSRLPQYLRADGHTGFTNAPGDSEVILGFNVPQTGPYADEGADELRAYELAVEHLNGGGDGGMMNTFSSKALKATASGQESRIRHRRHADEI